MNLKILDEKNLAKIAGVTHPTHGATATSQPEHHSWQVCKQREVSQHNLSWRVNFFSWMRKTIWAAPPNNSPTPLPSIAALLNERWTTHFAFLLVHRGQEKSGELFCYWCHFDFATVETLPAPQHELSSCHLWWPVSIFTTDTWWAGSPPPLTSLPCIHLPY